MNDAIPNTDKEAIIARSLKRLERHTSNVIAHTARIIKDVMNSYGYPQENYMACYFGIYTTVGKKHADFVDESRRPEDPDDRDRSGNCKHILLPDDAVQLELPTNQDE